MRHGVDCARSAAVLTAAVAAYAPSPHLAERAVLFAAAAAAIGAAWLAGRANRHTAGAVAMAHGAQAVVLVGQCIDPTATAATAFAAVWSLGAALAANAHATAPQLPRVARDIVAAGGAAALVLGVLGAAAADLAMGPGMAIAAAALLVGVDPLARASAALDGSPPATPSHRQTALARAVWWAAVAVSGAAGALAGSRTWGG
ncbi:MAG: hypothetical protein FJ100_12495 [Deltaproteobacteria bacterium]|nr:hypothetical protein [Deltaproteobacteria bacterium]